MIEPSTAILKSRSFEIGPCLRPVAYDSKSGLGYTAECFSGQLVAFDIDSGRVVDRRYIGLNARKIYVYDDLGLVVLTGCGVFQVDPPGAAAKAKAKQPNDL